MKVNGEYPKFYMRVEGKRYAAIPTSRNMCYILNNQTDSFTNCYFLCTKNKVIYVEVPEE